MCQVLCNGHKSPVFTRIACAEQNVAKHVVAPYRLTTCGSAVRPNLPLSFFLLTADGMLYRRAGLCTYLWQLIMCMVHAFDNVGHQSSDLCVRLGMEGISICMFGCRSLCQAMEGQIAPSGDSGSVFCRLILPFVHKLCVGTVVFMQLPCIACTAGMGHGSYCVAFQPTIRSFQPNSHVQTWQFQPVGPFMLSLRRWYGRR